MAANPDTGIVSIHGRQYMTVANRVKTFREDHPDWTIETQLISADDERVVMKALIFSPGDQRTIAQGTEHECSVNMEPKLVATGYAEEVRSASNINRTSALENAETSAVGRALAFYGLAGTEIASADEVAAAITQQRAPKEYPRMPAKQAREIADMVDAANLETGEGVDEFGEAWLELNAEEQKKYAPWVADFYSGEVTKHKQKMRDIMTSYRQRNNLTTEHDSE